MREITEYDNYKMPPPFRGEITPEVLKEREKARRKAADFAREMKEKYGGTDSQKTAI